MAIKWKRNFKNPRIFFLKNINYKYFFILRNKIEELVNNCKIIKKKNITKIAYISNINYKFKKKEESLGGLLVIIKLVRNENFP